MKRKSCESSNTIVAIATPNGFGAVGIVKISGPKVLKIAEKMLLKSGIVPQRAYFVPFYNVNNEVIDEGIAIFFKNPHSFTGEDILELQAHGNPIVLNDLVQTAIAHGARVANPGEFSERAFLNGKMDLIQAEAVADLIQATSRQAARSALHSLQGEFSKHIHQILDQLVYLRTYIEASLDFSEEDINFLADGKIESLLTKLLASIQSTTRSTQHGVLLQEGMRIVITGKPNAGKSSLLNAMSGRDSAIVADIAGTTRDVIREFIHIDGMPLHIIDTAGLHESKHSIEKEAIQRAINEIKLADHILFIQDITDTSIADQDVLSMLPTYILDILKSKPMTIVKNKIDLKNRSPKIIHNNNQTTIDLSAKYKRGIDLLNDHLKTCMGFNTNEEGVFIARRRHLDALTLAHKNISNARDKLRTNNPEIVAEELRLAQQGLSKITGQFTSEDLLSSIFSTFCIGK